MNNDQFISMVEVMLLTYAESSRPIYRSTLRDFAGYANKVMQDSNLCIVMIDGGDLQRMEQEPSSIVDVMNREANQAMKLKALNL